jgi:hypothetical protein
LAASGGAALSRFTTGEHRKRLACVKSGIGTSLSFALIDQVPPLYVCLRVLSLRRTQALRLFPEFYAALVRFVCLRVSGAVAPSAPAFEPISPAARLIFENVAPSSDRGLLNRARRLCHAVSQSGRAVRLIYRPNSPLADHEQKLHLSRPS